MDWRGARTGMSGKGSGFVDFRCYVLGAEDREGGREVAVRYVILEGGVVVDEDEAVMGGNNFMGLLGWCYVE